MDKDFQNKDQEEKMNAAEMSAEEIASPKEGKAEDARGQETEERDAELQEMKDKYVRLFAEFDNYKKRTARENVELRLTAGREIITSLLDVLDDMDRAEEQFTKSEDCNAVKEGSLLIFNKFRKIMESKGLKPLETLHTEFDVEKDEAISEVPVEDKKLKGKVIAEVQKGYALNDKIIRFAKVVVGK